MTCLTIEQFKALPQAEKLARTMAGLRKRETDSFAGNYTVRNAAGAGGAYQFVDRTWQGTLKQFGLSGPAQANQASKQLQDEVAGRALTSALARYNDDLFKVGVFWFFPIALKEPARLDIVPNSFNNLTPRQYATTFVNYVLCGPQGGEAYSIGGTFNYEWKNLPICVTDPRVSGEDVKQLKAIFGITEGPDVFGTALQYRIVRFQRDNNLPLTGCLDKATAAALNASLNEGDFVDSAGQYSAVASTQLVKDVLNNKNVSFDGSNTRDFSAGIPTGGKVYFPSEKLMRFILGFAQQHKFNISAIGSDHSLYIAGTKSVSLHRYGKAIDINYIDGHHLVSSPVNFWNNIANELVSLPKEYRPTRIGMTDFSSFDDRNGVIVFKNSGHRNHVHVSFD